MNNAPKRDVPAQNVQPVGEENKVNKCKSVGDEPSVMTLRLAGAARCVRTPTCYAAHGATLGCGMRVVPTNAWVYRCITARSAVLPYASPADLLDTFELRQKKNSRSKKWG